MNGQARNAASLASTRHLPRPPVHRGVGGAVVPDLLPSDVFGADRSWEEDGGDLAHDDGVGWGSGGRPRVGSPDVSSSSPTDGGDGIEFDMRTVSSFDPVDILLPPETPSAPPPSAAFNGAVDDGGDNRARTPRGRGQQQRLPPRSGGSTQQQRQATLGVVGGNGRGRSRNGKTPPRPTTPSRRSNSNSGGGGGGGGGPRSSSLPPRKSRRALLSRSRSPFGRRGLGRNASGDEADGGGGRYGSRGSLESWERSSVGGGGGGVGRNERDREDFARRANQESETLRRIPVAARDESVDSTSTSNSREGGGGGNRHRGRFVKARNKEGTIMGKLFGDVVSPEARQRPMRGATSGGATGGGGGGGGEVITATVYGDRGGGSRSTLGSDDGRAQEVVEAAIRRPDDGDDADDDLAGIYNRTLLTSSVYHNAASGLWIVTIDTNNDDAPQNNNDNLKAFAFPTESEAREAALAYAPPKMVPFASAAASRCHVCRGKFAVFRRAGHCRSCGVCVCAKCSTTWGSKRVPDTYNFKGSSRVKICLACDGLSERFRGALLGGDVDEVVRLYETGNVNLRCCFGRLEGETMFPIHAAVMGGSLPLLRWLVDTHYCPIYLTRTGNDTAPSSSSAAPNGRDDDDGSPQPPQQLPPILTSRGRSILKIAMGDRHIDILRYLVVEKGMTVHETRDLKTALCCLELTLRRCCDDFSGGGEGLGVGGEADDEGLADGDDGGPGRRGGVVARRASSADAPVVDRHRPNVDSIVTTPSFVAAYYHANSGDGAAMGDVFHVGTSRRGGGGGGGEVGDVGVEQHLSHYEDVRQRDASYDCDYDAVVPGRKSSDGSDDDDDQDNVAPMEDFDDEQTVTTVADACIICYENTIDCVMTPCGHQICCLQCSSSLSICPICNTECTFIRIFKP